MKRSSFLKSLIALIVSPKILGGINFKSARKVGSSEQLLRDLNLITPHYYDDLIKKYGNDSYLKTMGMFIPTVDPDDSDNQRPIMKWHQK